MTTTELIKILQDHEKGGISHKSREISLIINGRYMINPQIEVSGTGDGICGPEIDLDICGKWFESECDEEVKIGMKLEETNTVIETLTKLMEKGEKTNYERVILLDIAKSLAIIADKLCVAESE